MSAAAARWMVHGEHGISSLAIFNHLVLGDTTRGRWWTDYPADPDDFRRCERLLRAVPEIRPNLLWMSARHPVWAGLVNRWDDIVALIDEEAPGSFDGRLTAGCFKAYELMKEIEDAGRPDLAEQRARFR